MRQRASKASEMHRTKRGPSIHIGTSGWHYKHWRGIFYPAAMRPSDYLAYYSTRFQTVEINNSFYRLPSRETFEAWHNAVPPSFEFSVKASRYITHYKRLKDAADSVERFLEHMAGLASKARVVLFQLPPNWNVNVERLATFLHTLPRRCDYAFEFRDPSWFDDRVYTLLAEQHVAFCIHDMHPYPTPRTVTARLVYVRLHGSVAHNGDYSTDELEDWAQAMTDWKAEGRDVYCYLNNDVSGYALKNGQELRRMTTRV